MLNINFYCRAAKVNKQSLSPIEAAITYEGKRTFINLPIKANPNQPFSQDIKAYLSKIETLINTYHLNHPNINWEDIRYICKNGTIKEKSLQDIFYEYLDILKLRVGVDLTLATYNKYERVALMYLSEYETYSPKDIQRFYIELKSKYEVETSGGYMTKLKSIFTFARDNGYIQINPFNGIKIKKSVDKDITYLSDSEYNALLNHPLIPRLDEVRKAFILQINTGLSYTDLAKLRIEDIVTKNGTYYITKKRVKTGKQYTSVILEDGKKIVDEGFRIISNQRYNGYLKEIQDIIGSQRLHSHLARHTYAMRLLNSGVRVETVAAALGDSVKTVLKYYAKLTEERIINEIDVHSI